MCPFGIKISKLALIVYEENITYKVLVPHDVEERVEREIVICSCEA